MATIPLETIKQWLKACNADEALEPNDPRYINLETVEIDGKPAHLRGEDWIKPLYRTIQRADEPTCQLFSGYAGTGKTTELRRLKRFLEKATTPC